jgi:hypothetical protein
MRFSLNHAHDSKKNIILGLAIYRGSGYYVSVKAIPKPISTGQGSAAARPIKGLAIFEN